MTLAVQVLPDRNRYTKVTYMLPLMSNQKSRPLPDRERKIVPFSVRDLEHGLSPSLP